MTPEKPIVTMTLPEAPTDRQKAGCRLGHAAILYAISALQASATGLALLAGIDDLSFRRAEGTVDLSSAFGHTTDPLEALFEAARVFAETEQEEASAKDSAV